jgi:macrolide-specific efflux system membrane fusion protein
MVLTDLHQFEVAVPFTETDATKVSVGQAVTITFDSLPNVTLTGKVLSISVTSTVTNNVVSYAGLVSVVGDTTKVRPGMTATVDVALDKREGVVTLPTSAVSGTGSTAVVTVRRAGAPDQQRSIAIGLRGDNAIEVLSGLRAGEKVVTTIASGTSNGGLGNRAGGFGGPAGGGGVVRVGRGGGG